jgi:hypothetical protein
VAGTGLEIRTAAAADLPAVLAFLEEFGPKRQFFPRYGPEDFFTPDGALRDLRPADLFLAWRGGKLVGTLGAWDQRAFRQTQVFGYGGWLRWLRPAYNGWARLCGRPALPRPGELLRSVSAALPVIAADDARVFAALLQAARHRPAGGDYLLVGLHEADPLLGVLRPWRPTWYTTWLYHVCWPDGEAMRARLDGRVPYLELGSL